PRRPLRTGLGGGLLSTQPPDEGFGSKMRPGRLAGRASGEIAPKKSKNGVKFSRFPPSIFFFVRLGRARASAREKFGLFDPQTLILDPKTRCFCPQKGPKGGGGNAAAR